MMKKQNLLCVMLIVLTGGYTVHCANRSGIDSVLIAKGPGSLVCWQETRTQPRPLAISFIKLATNDRLLKVVTLPAIDPDSTGPAEAKLTQPLEIFTMSHAIAAINANAFAGTPGSEKLGTGWYEGRFVDMQGLVVANGSVRSGDDIKRTPLWFDEKGTPHIGHPTADKKVAQAVADWMKPLLENNRIVPAASDTVLHPRTLIGFNAQQNFILFVVVDGRQKGYSEGMSLYELALLMQEKGCDNAINLDGGGSSIMLLRNKNGIPQTINRPSGKEHRPVPVMIGIENR